TGQGTKCGWARADSSAVARGLERRFFAGVGARRIVRPEDVPQTEPVQVATDFREVFGEQLDIGGNLLVLQQRAGQPFAGLHIGGELLDGEGEVLNIFSGGGEGGAVGGQNV